MALKKIKLGKLIALCDKRNDDLALPVDAVRGIATAKAFIETKADMEGVSLHSYKVVRPAEFAYVPDTSRRGDKISLAYNSSDNSYLVSSISIVFRVVSNELDPYYLFMFFNRPEFDRYSRFNSWGSAREAFSWEEMCDIDIELPSIEIQRKYVDIYKGMVDNQEAYETGLEDLKLVCDGFVENLKKSTKTERIGQFIVELNERNENGKITLAQGVDVNLQFIPAKREAEDKDGGKLVHNGEFAFNKVVKCNGTKLPIALRKGPTCFISGSYTVFKVTDETKLIPEYLMLWMSREETQRKCGFNAWGSTRDVLPFEELCQLEIPYPSITVQQAIVDIYNAYMMRKEINEQLKQQIKNICPILIKGAVEEAKRS